MTHEQISQGSFGISYRAFDTRMKRDVALKFLHDSTGEHQLTAKISEKMVKDVNLLASIQHPNIATIYDVESSGERAYVVMELLPGKSTTQWIAEKPLSWSDFREVAMQVLDAFISTEKLGITHLNLRPDNMLLHRLPSGKIQVKIVDYGLARAFPQTLNDLLEKEENDQSIFCLAPEQLEDQPTDIRTDLYSLGCVYYFLLTGKYPAQGDTNFQIMAAHLHHFLRPLQEVCSDVPLWLCDWVMWHMNLMPADRPQNAEEALKVFESHDALPNPPMSSGSTDRAAFLEWAHRTSAHLLRIDPPAEPKTALNRAKQLAAGAPRPKAPGLGPSSKRPMAPTPTRGAVPAPTPGRGAVPPRGPVPAPVPTRGAGAAAGASPVRPPAGGRVARAQTVSAPTPGTRNPSGNAVADALLPAPVTRHIAQQRFRESLALKLKIGAGVLGAVLITLFFTNVQPRITAVRTVDKILDTVASGESPGVLLDSKNLNLLLNAATDNDRKTQRLTIYRALEVSQAEDDTDVDRRILQFIAKDQPMPDGVRAGLISQVIQKHNNPDMIDKLRAYADTTDDKAAYAAASTAADEIEKANPKRR